MHIDKLAIEELRLLVLLYKTHSLKDSAVRLNVSTPTASRMLARLRAAVEDELFIRSASAMTPTDGSSPALNAFLRKWML